MQSANCSPKPDVPSLESSRVMAAVDRIASSHDDARLSPTLVDDIAGLLLRHRDCIEWDEWKQFASVTFRAHSLFPTLQTDPYASYSFRKPRGYAGDAVLMDFIYGCGSSGAALDSSSELGRSIFRQISLNPAFS